MNFSTDYSRDDSFQKLHELDAQFDAQLREYAGPKSNRRPGKFTDTSFSLTRVALRLFVGVGLLVLPLFLLIRVSLFSYYAYNLNGWLALGLGASSTIFLLLIYSLYISYRFNKKARVHRNIVRVTVLLVVAYCCYGLLYLSSVNVKSEQVRSHYRSLHPILRVTVATATLADADLVITDMHRTPDDYHQMGLTPQQQSLHYVQPTGYVHAVDLRTIGRAEWKNWITAALLNGLGYHTLRHVGTANHLHVSMPLND